MPRLLVAPLLLALSLPVALGPPSASAAAAGQPAAPTVAAPGAAPEGGPAVQGRSRVLVTLDAPGSAVAAIARRQVGGAGGRLLHVYTQAATGYAAELPAAAVHALLGAPGVRRVEPDSVVRASELQPNPPIGLDRIDQRALPLSGGYSSARTGAGVTAYVVDTGIRRTHVDFEGRAQTGLDLITPGGTAEDCNGHGTHVAGTTGGRLAGVAKSVTLKAVRILDCDGTGFSSSLLAGLDFIATDHAPGVPAVAVLSLGGPGNRTVDDAVRRVVADGVTVVVAAGNETVDACGISPARVAEALTVSATDSRNAGGDARASFANFGDCLDLYAPGVSILSDTFTSDVATTRASGTSMAAPHVAGAAALHLQDEPTASPARVAQVLLQTATRGVVTDSRSATSDLLFIESREPEQPAPEPTTGPAPADSPTPAPESPAPPPESPAPADSPAPDSPAPAPDSPAPAPESPAPESPAPADSPTAQSPAPAPEDPSPTPDGSEPPATQRVEDSQGRFIPVRPARLLDTRGELGGYRGRLPAGDPVEVQVSGRAGVPASGATAVALNVTVVGAEGPGHLTVYPAGQAPPGSSNLNFRPSSTVPNAVLSGLSEEGRLALLANGGGPYVIVDVVGYYADGLGGSRSTAVPPDRLLDTRTSLGDRPGRLPAGVPVDLQVTGRSGVPDTGVTAAVLNVTAVDAQDRGHLTVFPSGTQVPLASSLNFVRGQTVPNLVLAAVGPDGRVLLQASSGAPHVVVDVVAWYSDTTSVRGSARFVPLPPQRVLDTRDSGDPSSGRLRPGVPTELPLAGRAGVPGVGVMAVVLNVTVVGADGPGHLTVFPPDAPVPLASNLNYVRGQTTSNLVWAKVGVDSEVQVNLQASSGSPHVIVDVVGYTEGAAAE